MTHEAGSSGWLRRAGRLDLGAGRELHWSVADGHRGRRWRGNVISSNGLSLACLLELDRRGRPTRLELSTPAGLLTLHPEPDESELHGNIVRAAGVEPLTFDWSAGHWLHVAGCSLPTLAMLAALPATESAQRVRVVAIDVSLRARADELVVRYLGGDRWQVGWSDGRLEGVDSLTVAEGGLPGGDNSDEWPLEP